MFEKVNPAHPDKLADRIAGAIVDLCYARQDRPKVAAEVLVGHGLCTVIVETSVTDLSEAEVVPIVERIAGAGIETRLVVVQQDANLARNQSGRIRCGDNGIFRGTPISVEEAHLASIAAQVYSAFPSDGKYILDGGRLIVCQSRASAIDVAYYLSNTRLSLIVNPLGDWYGGPEVDTGATNRKLGSDMGRACTGGGLHGKDLSKADVSVNIYLHLKAQRTNTVCEACCAIGDETVDGVPFEEIVAIAEEYIKSVGGFEKFAEWGLIY